MLSCMLGGMEISQLLTIALLLVAALAVGLAIGLTLGSRLGALRAEVAGATQAQGQGAESRPEVAAAASQRAADDAVLREGLDRLADQMRELEHNRAVWQGQLRQHVDDMRHSTDGLRRETQALSHALRKPQVRGRWGEMQLRRAVELAGLVDRCDFDEQTHLVGDNGALRPDLVVHLAGGKQVVVDSKVPLDAFLDATGADEPDEAAAHLRRHAHQVRSHIDALGAKRYWRAIGDSPEFVVLFLPGESFLSAALEGDRDLLEHAAGRNVVLATPTTLIALLRTVAHGWSHEVLTDRAREVHQLGRELHERIGTMGGHVDKLGRSLGAAVTAYNQTIGSLEGRVLVTARKLEDLGIDGDLPAPAPIEQSPRVVSAEELDSARRARGA